MHVLSSREIVYAEPHRFSIVDHHPTRASAVQFHFKQWQHEDRSGWKILHSFQSAATTAGITADLAQPIGDPSRVLPEEACKWGADLLVIGCRGLFRLNELMLDSISHYVPQHAPYSILIVPRPTVGPKE